MTRKPQRREKASALVNIALHPEIHKLIAHEAIDADVSIREQLHSILCEHYDRRDLIGHANERLAATA